MNSESKRRVAEALLKAAEALHVSSERVSGYLHPEVQRFKKHVSPDDAPLIVNSGKGKEVAEAQPRLFDFWLKTHADRYTQGHELDAVRHAGFWYWLTSDKYSEQREAALSNLGMDEHELPSALFFDVKQQPLLKNEWLVHFTNNAMKIAEEGFVHGVADPKKLGLTVFIPAAEKTGGFNFAYEASDKRFIKVAQRGWHGWRFGEEAVVFRANGIRVWHRTDEQSEVVFWGKSAHDRVALKVLPEDGWCVLSRGGRTMFASDDDSDDGLWRCIQWVKNNYEQYRKPLSASSSGFEPSASDPKRWRRKAEGALGTPVSASAEELFHGSNQLFNEFSKEKIGKSQRGPGVFFSNSEKYAKVFGPYVYRCSVSLKNPKVYPTSMDFQVDVLRSGDDVTALYDSLKADGHDGVVIKKSKVSTGVVREVIAFDPSSATILSGPKPLSASSKLSTVYHVGNLDSPRKKPHVSYEGSGLSVSLHPDAWRKIARGHVSGDTWELSKDDPKFLLATKANKEKAAQWAVKNGWLEEATRYRVSWFDDEMDDEVSMEFDSLDEAQAEDRGEPEPVNSYTFAKKGKDYWRKAFQSKPDNSMASDFAVLWFAEGRGYDGVWWNDKLDPVRLSAPRGVIFQSRLGEWSKKKVTEAR